MILKKNIFQIRPELIGEISQIGIGQVFATLGGFIGVSLLTKALSPSTYGELGLCLTLLTLSQQLIFGPFGTAFARYFPVAFDSECLNEYFTAVKKIALYGIAGLFIPFAGFIVFACFSGREAWIILGSLTFLFTLISSLNIVLDNIQNAGRHRVIVAWHQCAGQWSKFIFALFFIYIFSPSSTFAMIGYLFSAIFVLISQSVFFKKQFLKITTTVIPNSKKENYWEKQMIGFSIPFCSWGLFTWAQMVSDRWALQTFQSLSDVGKYVVVYQIGFYPVIFLTNVFVQFISPILFRKAGAGNDEDRLLNVRKITSKLVVSAFLFTLVISGLAWVFEDLVFKVFVASEYQSVAYLFPIMVLAGGFFATGQVCSLDALNKGKPAILIFPKIVTAIIGIATNVIGAMYFGTAGVVYSQVVFSIIFLIWVYVDFEISGRTARKIS